MDVETALAQHVRALRETGLLSNTQTLCTVLATDDDDASSVRFVCPFSTRAQLASAMHSAMRSVAMQRLLRDPAVRLVNLDEVDLDGAVRDGRLELVFRAYYGNEPEFAGLFGWIGQTPAYAWTAQPVDDARIEQVFGTLSCTDDTQVPAIKLSPCSRGKSSAILFFKGARDLGDYMRKLNSGRIAPEVHQRIFDLISAWPRFKNHNMDVPVLHFKYT